jgi:hypothetical protein
MRAAADALELQPAEGVGSDGVALALPKAEALAAGRAVRRTGAEARAALARRQEAEPVEQVEPPWAGLPVPVRLLAGLLEVAWAFHPDPPRPAAAPAPSRAAARPAPAMLCLRIASQ